MFYDRRGQGSVFYFCTNSSSEYPSKRGTNLYKKIGNQKDKKEERQFKYNKLPWIIYIKICTNINISIQ